ncbi:protein Shroom1 [Ascaphus truei]|uniref:protein Shroom1 n=1 Tax=Ascaphus truei TaxID=8439 RepID=UPI003F59F009
MSSFGNHIERWSMNNTTGGIAELMHPMTSDDYPERLSPVKSIATIVDSAYSSFSGSSYVPENYQTASFLTERYHLNDEQLSYMDSEYVKAIYNPSANLYQNINSEDGSSHAELPGSSTIHTLGCNTTSEVSPQPPTPPARLDSYIALQNFDQPKGNSSYGDHFSQNVKLSLPSDGILFAPDHKTSRGNWQTRVKESVQGEVHKEHNPSYSMENDCFTRSFLLFEYLKSDGVTKTQDALCTEKSLHNSKIEEQMNPKSSHPPHLGDEVNCTSKNKHYSQMNTQIFKGMDMQGKTPQIRDKDGNFPSEHFNIPTENELKQNEYQAQISTKRSLSEFVPERLGVHENKGGCWIMKPGNETHCCNSAGTKDEEVGELVLNQPHKEQKPPLFQNDKADSASENHGQCDIRRKQLLTKASQIFYCGPNKDVLTKATRTLNHENENHGGTKTLNLRKDATIKPLPLLSKQHEPQKSKGHPFCDLTSEKINKATTPMLYHLAGGRHFTPILSCTNQAKQQEKGLELKTFQRVGNVFIPQPTEVQKDSKPHQKNISQPQLADNIENHCGDDEAPGSQTFSAEECLMHDYREKLKFAQKKVLRETSFKRKDLQMSLPGRLKLNPSKRPSIDHLRSYSLSSANEVQLKSSVGTSNKKDKVEKPTVSQIGRRKRITKEQRKLCYSEPEKLDQLGIHNSAFTWREKGAGSTQNEMSDSGMKGNSPMSQENKERALSSSSLSKTELKQMQHNALIQYMERKTSQRPNSAQPAVMQRTSVMRRYPEWNCISSETPSNDVSQTYLTRRSAGTSSSYDATLTWNDIIMKSSVLGETVHSADQSGGENCLTYVDQCTSKGNHKYSDSSPTICQEKSKLTHLVQVLNGCVAFSDSGECSNPAFNRLNVTEEDTSAVEKESVCTARGRGKSMEELGTTDIIRPSVLSQSTDQLYHMKGPVILPEHSSGTAVLHQDKLQTNTDNESGKLPRQTSKEDLLGPQRSDAAHSAQEKHSRPLQATAVSSSTDQSCSSPSSLELYLGASKQLQSFEAEDEVFFHPITTRMEMPSRTTPIPQDDASKPLCNGQEAPSPLLVLPCHIQLEQQTKNESTPSFETFERYLPEDGKEVRTEKDYPSQSSALSNPPGCGGDHQNLGAERGVKSGEDQSMGNSQQEELSHIPSIQVIPMNCIQTSQSLFGQGKHDGNGEAAGQTSMASMQKSRDPEREADLPRVKLKSSEDQRSEELVKEIIAKDKSLVDILQPLPVRESAMDLMKSLFPADISAMEKSRNRGLLKKEEDGINPRNRKLDLEITSKLPTKAILLLQKHNIHKPDGEYIDDITSKKMELISNIHSKLEALWGQREFLLSDIHENMTRGRDLEAMVKGISKPNEYERYMMFIGDLEKVVSLLFCLSMRLARVENAMSKIDDNTDAEERQSLKQRHSLLSRQREDAKDLKENLDRRERVVTGILAKYLSEHQLQDYKYFVRLKTSFLIEQKDLEEKIKCHEEQLESIHNSIPP